MPIVWGEDDDDDRFVIATCLEDDPGLPRVRFARNGPEVLAKVAEKEPRLVVLDLNKPASGGLHALRRLRQQWNHLPVVVFATPRSEDEARSEEELAKARELGATQVIEKPPRFQEFCQVVRTIVRQAASSPDGGSSGSPS